MALPLVSYLREICSRVCLYICMFFFVKKPGLLGVSHLLYINKLHLPLWRSVYIDLERLGATN